jgi:hypothetical protein
LSGTLSPVGNKESSCTYLGMCCEGPVPFPTNVPGIAGAEGLYADLLGKMVLSDGVHPAGMLKYVCVAGILVNFAKSQLQAYSCQIK